ncbi:MAG: EscU/YscU/HrcU family type III secretion system export apparatus switch protein [bacterium]|jgi:flagellar biosynthesis protein|nr:hypothetical protein [Planctomycetota bacterium]HIL51840.1 hypothetical protein [Planctomycetota bacterium]
MSPQEPVQGALPDPHEQRAGAPTRAIALCYDDASASAPTVVASGAGELARQILAVAEATGVPVREDADLVTLLSACDLGEEIPAELFEAVAEILSWLYRLNRSLGE